MRTILMFLVCTTTVSAAYVVWRTYTGDVRVVHFVEQSAVPVSAHARESFRTASPPPVQRATTTARRILFVGDMFFDRYIRSKNEQYGDNHALACVDDLLRSADYVVGNLEGPITDNASVNVGTKGNVPQHYTFTFPTTTAALLARHNITVVNIGNNHIGNFGLDGISSTRRYLAGAGVSYFGGLYGDEPAYRDGTLSFVSYNQFGGTSTDAVAGRIRDEVADGQRVIVYTHWGDEYVTVPGYLRDIAKRFVDAGASAIFGSHPHVVIPMEYIRGVPVYYSLGNFLFDQYFSREVTTGQAVLATIDDSGIETQPVTLALSPDGTVCLADTGAGVGR